MTFLVGKKKVKNDVSLRNKEVKNDISPRKKKLKMMCIFIHVETNMDEVLLTFDIYKTIYEIKIKGESS